jgi:2-polyprenyl-3-methyl-5-hydroxy-6-metoxy-1,4-benzoquinol methylase/spore coat polysaccharide biosynthesis protein SpsF (cytidylyltransferase family)
MNIAQYNKSGNNNMKIFIFVQAHHENWGGGKSYCLSIVKGSPVILHVLKKLRKYFPKSEIIMVVPDEKENRQFEPFAKEVQSHIYYGSKVNVLDRFLGAATTHKCDAFIRVIGEHYFIDLDYVNLLKQRFETGGGRRKYDIVTPPLNFDPKFGAEIVSVKALIKCKEIIYTLDENRRNNALANPINFIVSQQNEFIHSIEQNIPIYPYEEIVKMREIAKEIYLEAYEFNENKSQKEGDILRMHYELAKKYIAENDNVLDVACGNGWGSAMITPVAKRVIGVDISEKSISEAKEKYKISNLSFEIHNALNMDFKDEFFDVIISMETIEHIDGENFLKEVYRILRKEGLFIVSTPQNCSGSFPLIPYHLREYTLDDFKKLLSQFFVIQNFYSFRSNYVLEGEHIGTGMMAICKKTDKLLK